jgi:hypothetical protein
MGILVGLGLVIAGFATSGLASLLLIMTGLIPLGCAAANVRCFEELCCPAPQQLPLAETPLRGKVPSGSPSVPQPGNVARREHHRTT